MKKTLLISGLTAISIAAMAESAVPTQILDARILAVSPNGKYAVSNGAYGGMKILNLSTWNEDSDSYQYFYEEEMPGHGRCISDNGIVVGVSQAGIPEYWKDGDWYYLNLPKEVVSSSLATSISADGSRICGSLGLAPVSLDGDALMQVPCLWKAEGDEYGMPILLPHPERDFSGRVPQYILANDISADGKTIVGQVRDAVGMVHYPIIYREDENGEWTYELVHMDLINPNGVVIPEYPGEGPMMPSQENFMSPAELQAYNEAINAYVNSGYQLPYPSYEDYMTEKEIEEYLAAVAEYEKLYEKWSTAYEEWSIAYQEVAFDTPGYVLNSVLISPDGKTFGSTIEQVDFSRPVGWGFAVDYETWVFDVNSTNITKYKGTDLNLTCMCNDGVALGSTSVGTASQSFVLKNGNVIGMYDWMKSTNPENASWMENNMVYPYEIYNFETGELESKEEVLSGRAVATPDLSLMILSVENIWDYMDAGDTYIFNMNVGSGVESVNPSMTENSIYDLSGRKLKNADAPGIYIINGEKRMVR